MGRRTPGGCSNSPTVSCELGGREFSWSVANATTASYTYTPNIGSPTTVDLVLTNGASSGTVTLPSPTDYSAFNDAITVVLTAKHCGCTASCSKVLRCRWPVAFPSAPSCKKYVNIGKCDIVYWDPDDPDGLNGFYSEVEDVRQMQTTVTGFSGPLEVLNGIYITSCDQLTSVTAPVWIITDYEPGYAGGAYQSSARIDIYGSESPTIFGWNGNPRLMGDVRLFQYFIESPPLTRPKYGVRSFETAGEAELFLTSESSCDEITQEARDICYANNSDSFSTQIRATGAGYQGSSTDYPMVPPYTAPAHNVNVGTISQILL